MGPAQGCSIPDIVPLGRDSMCCKCQGSTFSKSGNDGDFMFGTLAAPLTTVDIALKWDVGVMLPCQCYGIIVDYLCVC